MLLETRTYPPCKHLFGDGPVLRRRPLVVRGNSMQFVLKDNSHRKRCMSRLTQPKPDTWSPGTALVRQSDLPSTGRYRFRAYFAAL